MPPMKARKVPDKKYTPWEVAVPKSITGTKRVRKFFAERTDADAYIVRVKQDGFNNADLREDDAKPGMMTLAECTAMWRGRNEGIGPGAQAQIRAVTESLDTKFRRRAIDQITHRDLDAWLRDNPNGYVTKLNYHRIARRFFAYAHDWLEVIPRNPMIKVPKPTGERNPVQIFTPDEMRDCLGAAARLKAPHDFRITAFLCLGGFAGIRVDEILRMEWQDVNWESGEIYVRQPKRVKGWKPRYVDIVPALRRHVQARAPKEGKVIPGGQRSLYLARLEMMQILVADGQERWKSEENEHGVAWPDNCLRHSFKTYHAAHFQNVESTKIQMGHSDDNMTKYQYGAPEARKVAADWWEI